MPVVARGLALRVPTGASSVVLARIWAVALAEMRSAQRQVRTWVFSILAVGASLAMFVNSGVSHANIGWIAPPSAALPAPRFVISQVGVLLIGIFLVGIIFLAFDVRARDRRARMVDVLDARPVANTELLAGRVLGVVATALVPTLAMLVLVQAVGALMPEAQPVQGIALASFLLVDAVPLFLAWTALTVLLAVALRNRLLAAVAALGLFVAWVWWSTRTPLYLAHLVGSTGVVGSASDLLPRFAEPETLTHRLLLLVLGAGAVVAAAVLHPRPDSQSRLAGLGVAVALVVFGGAGMFGLYRHAVDGVAERQRWLTAHQNAAGSAVADVEHVEGVVRILPGRSLDIDVALRLSAGTNRAGPGPERLVFSLNPGLAVEEARVDGAPARFEHHDGLLTVSVPSSSSALRLQVRASGMPVAGFAYLDSAHDFWTDSTGNENTTAHLGRDASVFETEYVALMPGIAWLPTPGPNIGVDDPAVRGRDFHTLDLVVEAPPDWLVAGPGQRQTEAEGRFRFAPSAPVPAVALFASAFERRAMEVAGVEFEVLMHPRHIGVVDLFEDAAEGLREHLEELFDNARRLGLAYPYRSLSVVEVPGALRRVGGGWRMDTVQGLPGIMLMGEHGFPTVRFDLRFAGLVENGEVGVEDHKIRVLQRLLASDFQGGNPYSGVARNFVHHQVGVEPGGSGATALAYVVDNLAVRLLTESDGFFSAHVFTPAGAGSVGLLTQLGTDVVYFGAGSSRSLDRVANRPVVWDLALATSLAGLDPTPDPAGALDVLALKGGAVARTILDALGREKTGALLSELRRRHLGGHYDLAAFYGAARDVGADLEALLGDWRNDAALPGFLASTATMARLPDTHAGEPRYQTRVHVRNDEPVPGLVRLRYVTRSRAKMRGLTPEQTVPVRVAGNTSVEMAIVTPRPVATLWMSPYLSLNRGDVQVAIDRSSGVADTFRQRDRTVARKRRDPRPGAGNRVPGRQLAERDPSAMANRTSTDAVDAFHGARPSDWRPRGEAGILVDDLDAGFRVERDSRRSGFRIGAGFSPIALGGEMDHGIPSFISDGVASGLALSDGEWRRQELPSSWGRYRHTVARAAAVDGHARAVFEAELPQAGGWRVEYHMPFVPSGAAQKRLVRGGGALARMGTIGRQGDYEMALEFGDGGRVDVPFDAAGAETGWNDLGRYTLPKGRVRLAVSNRTTGEVVLADAVRWRGVGDTPAAAR